MGKDSTQHIDGDEAARLTAALLVCLVREVKDPGGQIQVMDALGVSDATIAKALDLNPISVRTARHRKRHSKKR
jgi:hypothetical protein